jgi:hypothetical protein
MMSGGTQVAVSIGPWIGYALGALAALALIWASFEFASADARFNVVLLISGGLIGWVIGMLLIPGAAEKDQFSAAGTAIATFVGGYLVAKFDKVFDLSFRERGDLDASVIGRSLLFVSGLALGVLFTFVWRAYVMK